MVEVILYAEKGQHTLQRTYITKRKHKSEIVGKVVDNIFDHHQEKLKKKKEEKKGEDALISVLDRIPCLLTYMSRIS